MNAMLEFVSGRCTNELFCAVASAGDVVRLPVGARFVCSYCGSKLVEQAPHKRRVGIRTGMVLGGAMGSAGIAMFAIGYFLGKPPVAPVTPSAALTPGLTAAVTVVAQQPAVLPPRVAAATTHIATPADNNAPPPLPQAVPGPSFQSHPAASSVEPAVAQPTVIRAPVFPTGPAKPQTSQSAMTPSASPLMFAMAERPLVSVAKVRTPAPSAPVPKGTANDTAIAAAHLAALPAPSAAATAPAPAAPDSDSLNQAEVARLAAPSRTVANVEPPAPAIVGPTRGFLPQPAQGGAPSYPAAYEGGDRTGRVTVKCRIEASGSPTGCNVVASHGGRAFDMSVLNWLGSGRVRFAPILHNGQATAETHEWSVNFQPAGG